MILYPVACYKLSTGTYLELVGLSAWCSTHCAFAIQIVLQLLSEQTKTIGVELITTIDRLR